MDLEGVLSFSTLFHGLMWIRDEHEMKMGLDQIQLGDSYRSNNMLYWHGNHNSRKSNDSW